MSGAAPSEDPDDLRRLAEASAWRVSLTEADLDTSPQVEAWLASHEANRAAWKQVQDSWSLFDSPAATVQVTAMRRAALARRRPRPMRRAEPWMWRSAAAAACAVVVGLGLWLSLQPQTYETARGERRSLVLQDGSRVAMDSDTLLQVRLTRGARRLDLVRGQARFDVAHDKARPFTVHVGDEAVVATGTSVDIDKLGSKVTVTWIEGRGWKTPPEGWRPSRPRRRGMFGPSWSRDRGF